MEISHVRRVKKLLSLLADRWHSYLNVVIGGKERGTPSGAFLFLGGGELPVRFLMFTLLLLKTPLITYGTQIPMEQFPLHFLIFGVFNESGGGTFALSQQMFFFLFLW